MKALLYLVGLIVVGVLVVWLVFGISPQEQWERVKSEYAGGESAVSGQVSNLGDAAGRLKDRASDRWDEAEDVYTNGVN